MSNNDGVGLGLLMFVVLGIVLFLAGCVSPQVIINKNVEVNINLDNVECGEDVCGTWPTWVDVSIEYKTETDMKTKLDIDQDISPKTTVPIH